MKLYKLGGLQGNFTTGQWGIYYVNWLYCGLLQTELIWSGYGFKTEIGTPGVFYTQKVMNSFMLKLTYTE